MRQGKGKSGKILLDELDLLKFLFRDLLSAVKNAKAGDKLYNKKPRDAFIDDIVRIEEAIARQKSAVKKAEDIKGGNAKPNADSANEGVKSWFSYCNAEIKNDLKGSSFSYGISVSSGSSNGEKLDIEISGNNGNNYRYSLSVSYGYNAGYLQRHIEGKNDFTERVPLKFLNILPESMMGGVLGFTYIGDPSMGRRADLAGGAARMVDIHESIHTPDEYETRVLTEWIMNKVGGNVYNRIFTTPKEK